MEEIGANYAIDVSKINREMLEFRKTLEIQLKKSLTELEISYKKTAFDALSGESKNALLTNAKLKEELLLQNVGLENLKGRLEIQKDDVKSMSKDIKIFENSFQNHTETIAVLNRKKLLLKSKMKDMQQITDTFRQESIINDTVANE